MDAFWGYYLAHEDGGVYGGDEGETYVNLEAVIDEVRSQEETRRRLVAVGNVTDTTWTAAEQASFREIFFRNSEPANVLLHEAYVYNNSIDTNWESIEGYLYTYCEEPYRIKGLYDLIIGFDSAAAMVDTAIREDYN